MNKDYRICFDDILFSPDENRPKSYCTHLSSDFWDDVDILMKTRGYEGCLSLPEELCSDLYGAGEGFWEIIDFNTPHKPSLSDEYLDMPYDIEEHVQKHIWPILSKWRMQVAIEDGE